MGERRPAHGMPERIGRYRILRWLGGGGMGNVYAADDEKAGRPVALKVLMGDLESNPETRARFHREAKAAGGLDHRNIITIFDAGQDRGRSFIVMQLLEGLPLQKFLEEQPAAGKIEAKLDLMVQMCEGLAAAHAHGVIHRDLKPSNLFVESNGLLKILDFGVARIPDSSMTLDGTMLGTPDYMSPEQARGVQVDARSDIYSAGAVFYFMLAGRKPLPGPTLPELFEQIEKTNPEPLGPGVPSELAAIVARAMAKEPADRPARIEELLTLLVRFRRHFHGETRRMGLAARTRYDAAEGLVQAAAAAETALELPTDAAPKAALQAIQEEFAPPGARGSFEMTALDRGRVGSMLAQLEELTAPLQRKVQQCREYAAALEAGTQALSAGDALRALQTFEGVSAAIGSPRAQRLAMHARPLAEAQRIKEEQVRSCLDAAREALEARDPGTAVAECRRALQILPERSEVLDVLADAEHHIERERRRVERIVEHLVHAAEQALTSGDLDAAEHAVDEALTADPGSATALATRQRVERLRDEQAIEEELRQLIAHEIRRARGTFRRGGYDEAIQQLQGFLEERPEATQVRAELEALAFLRETLMTAAAAVRRHAVEAIARATALRDGGDVPGAMALLRDLLPLDPTNIEAATLLDRLAAQDLKDRIAREQEAAAAQREADAQPLLAAARHALDQGYASLALQAALAAHRLAPNHAGAAALVDAARSDLTSDSDDEQIELSPSPFPEAMITSTPAVMDVPGAVARAIVALRNTVLGSRT